MIKISLKIMITYQQFSNCLIIMVTMMMIRAINNNTITTIIIIMTETKDQRKSRKGRQRGKNENGKTKRRY